jgi:hypothetical protein
MLKDFVDGNFECKFTYIYLDQPGAVSKMQLYIGPLAGSEPAALWLSASGA